MAGGAKRLSVIIDADVGAFNKSISGMQKAMKDATSGVSKSMGGIGGAVKGAVGNIGKIAGTLGIWKALDAGINMVKGSITSAFSRIDTMEQFERVMTTMLGSTDKAKASLERINGIVKGTSYGLDIASKATQRFVTGGMEVSKAEDTIEAWGNAVSFYGDGSNQTFETVTDAMSKMNTKGKVGMEQLNRILEAGIPVFEIFADATGMSMEEVQKAFSSGEISAEQFTEIMNGALMDGTDKFKSIAGASKEAGASWGATFDNMKAAVTRGVVGIIQSIDEMLNNNGLPDMRQMVSNFGVAFENGLNKAGGVIAPLIGKLIGLYMVIKDSTAWETFKQAIGLVIDKGKELFTAFIESPAWETIKTTLKDLGNALLEIDFATIVTGVMDFLSTWAPLIAGIVAGIAIFKGLMGIITLVKGVMVAWGVITGILSAGLLPVTATVLAIAVAIGALVAVGVWLYKNWDEIAEQASAIWGALGEFFKGVIDTIVNAFKEDFNQLKEFFSGLWTSISEGISTAWSGITEFFSTLWAGISEGVSSAWNGIKEFFSALWAGIVEMATAIWTPIAEFFTTLWEGVKTVFSVAWEGIKVVLTVILGVIMVLIATIWNQIADTINTIMNVIKTVISVVWQAIQVAIQTVMNVIQTTILPIWEAIKAGVVTVVEAIKERVTAIWNAIKEATSSIFEAVKSVVTTVWTAISTKVAEVVNTMKTIITTVFNAIKTVVTTVVNSIKSTVTTVFEAIKSVTTTVWNAIKSVITTVMEAIKSTATTVWNAIKSVITSVVTAIQSTISSVFNAIKSVVTSVFNAIKSVATSVWNGIKSTITSVVNGIRSTVTSTFNGLKSTVTGIWNGIKSSITTPIESAKNAVRTAINAMKGFFNFSWKLPSIKMPKFSVSGSANPLDWFKQGVPKLGVSWHAKGGIATGASIVGVGEAGDEAIVPLSQKHRMKPFAEAVADMMPKQETGNNGGGTIITGNTFVVREEADIKKIAQELKRLDDRNSRGRGKGAQLA